MPLTPETLQEAMSALRNSDHSGFWHGVLNSTEQYLRQVEARTPGTILPTALLGWIQRQNPSGDAIRFAFWALHEGGRVDAKLPALQAPSATNEIWGWVELFQLHPHWRNHFYRLGAASLPWRRVTEQWESIERLGMEWRTTTDPRAQGQLLAMVARLIEDRPPVVLPTDNLLPPPPAPVRNDGVRFPLTPSREIPAQPSFALVAPRQATDMAMTSPEATEAFASMLVDRVSSTVGVVLAAERHRIQEQVAETLTGAARHMEETVSRRVEERLAAGHATIMQNVQQAFTTMGMHEPTFGEGFRADLSR